jgi:hypothetical protein
MHRLADEHPNPLIQRTSTTIRRAIMTQAMIFAIFIVSTSALGTRDRYCTSNVVCIEFQMLETVLKARIGELAAKDDRILGSLISAEL